jgi:dTDP-3-amino-2,3,6-trideoxy-4-keto-D-glucose/dTDP-3-amino-3,4,6-trideoxy-alpha-D-glucose/dTDP-2,6-dideoxy-D-kanosamine transaminase
MIPLFSSAIANRGLDLQGALARVLASNSFIMGQEVAQFEQEFASFIGVSHCISVANGTDALELALRALGVGDGAAVVCVANAGFYSATAVHLAGAVPVYVDVHPDTLTMSTDALAVALRQRPAAVIVTHLYGQLAEIEAISRICRDAGVPLIEDCAQSHGAQRSGLRGGSFADVSCFSFYPTKNLGALGDGGAILTGDESIASRLKSLRQYGWSKKYEVSRLGGCNSRLDELQAAVLREKLKYLDQQNSQRRAIASRYNEAFADLPIQRPASVAQDYVAHLYVIRTPQREALRAHLQAAGVGSDVHYPIPDTRQPAFSGRFDQQSLPVTEAACASVMSLPCFPGLGDGEVQKVIQAVREFFRHGKA